MSKAILFNAPAKNGKDIAINYLKNQGYPLVVRECKDLLHELTMKMFCIPEYRYWQIYNDRSLKEVPLDEFSVSFDFIELEQLGEILGYDIEGIHRNPVGFTKNLSIREAMIYVSEILMKPRFGFSYFGLARANSIQDGEIIVDGSCGFPLELPPLIDKLGQENILLLRIHREGYNFDGDSRNYIPDGIITNTVDIDNNGTEQEYFDKVEKIVREFLYG